MKHLLTVAVAILVLTGCRSNDYQGNPGEDRYIEGQNDRATQNRTSDNMRDTGAQHSPSFPVLGNGSSNSGNGSGNF